MVTKLILVFSNTKLEVIYLIITLMYWALIRTLLDTRITKKTQITFSDWSSNYQQWQVSLNKVVVWVSFTRLAVALNIRRVTTVDVIQRHQW